MQEHLAKMQDRGTRYRYLLEIPSQALQQVCERADNSYQAFFEWAKTKTGPRRGPPRLKKVRRFKSFTLKQAGWSIEPGENRIRIGDVVYRYHRSQNVHGKIKTVTIKQDACGDWWISFACDPLAAMEGVKENKIVKPLEKFAKDDERRQKVRTETGKSSGFDFGLRTFLTSSEGEGADIVAPEPLKASLNKLARRNRALASKVKGSKNWHKARLELARAYRDAANIREDFHKKTASTLCKEYDALFFEDLNLVGMKAIWGRKASDLGFGKQLAIIENMALFSLINRLWRLT
jgi:putative transposase